MRRLLILFLLLAAAPGTAAEGLLNLQSDPDTGKLLLSFESLPTEFLYVPALESGAGSNDLGLDRGQMDRSRFVRFERYGNKVLLVEPNLAFRAYSDNPNEVKAVEQAFAQSVLAGFDVQDPGSSRTTIDLTPFLLSDIRGVTDRIAALEQGTFLVDPARSAVDSEAILNFPLNSLIPAIVTFSGTGPGDFVKDVTPTPDSLSLRVSHQFIALPEDGYKPRVFHPRSGYFSLDYSDYAAPLDERVERKLIYRHRLEPGNTLTYYVDSGAPEPIRSALLEGASWWAEAFAAAGFENAFEVEVLPEGANPLDVRYNVIQWVHRSTRGWSYGFNVNDPRTGEIIKGHVSLGSLRVRQDQLIAEALTAPFTSPDSMATDAREMALARLRQLSAHEVGHTLGIDHNFAASFSGDASVMDYPHPNLYLGEKGQVMLDRAYSSGISEWDKLAVRYGYSPFDAADESAGLAAILAEGRAKGIAFIGDQDARVPGAAHPGAHLWDNGSDVLERLRELLDIRQAGLDNFSASVLPDGSPLFEMERRLAPVYLLHRYQLDAAAKLVGGLYYDYGLKGEEMDLPAPVERDVQEKALDSILALLNPASLALPENLRNLIPPPALTHQRGREYFDGRTGPTFDHLAPSRAGAEIVISTLLQPQRLSRLAGQRALDQNLPGADDVINGLVEASWYTRKPGDSYLSAIRTETNWLVLRGLIELASGPETTDTVRAVATGALVNLSDELSGNARKGDPQALEARRLIQTFLQRPMPESPAAPVTVPPGSPIG